MGKKRGKHQSFDKAMKPFMARLDASHLVKKIVLGEGEGTRHSFTPGKVKIQRQTEAGFKLKAFTDRGVMNLFVVCDKLNADQVRQLIQEFVE